MAPERSSQARRYLMIFAPMIVLTIIAFALALGGVFSFTTLAAIILIMAAIQFFLQAYLFMHLNIGRRAYRMAFGAGLFAAMIIWVGLFILLRY